MEKPIVKNLIQLVLIVFSVVLGIFLSERIEEQKSKREAVKLLSKITLEVEDNKRLIEDWTPYHIEIVRRLDSLSNDIKFVERFIGNKSILFSEVFTRRTIMARRPASDAWDIAKSHPLIVRFDYDELLMLSKIYNQQEDTYKSFSKISEIFYAPDFNSKGNAAFNLRRINNLIQEMVGLEMQLIGYYKEAEGFFDLQTAAE